MIKIEIIDQRFMLFRKLVFTYLLIVHITSKCAYKVLADGKPEKLKQGDDDLKPINDLQECVQYNGEMGCCDANNDFAQIQSYGKIDGVFGHESDGCDICAINLKRFWCQYACSPNQASFLDIADEWIDIVDPQNPDKTIKVQNVTLTVHADTACDLYSSCKRIGFVTSVSAMGSPAGFLSFQGHNAVDDAYQYISVKFSNSYNNSLYFSNSEEKGYKKSLQQCNMTTNEPTLHGFNFTKNCTCNNCENSCTESGFEYEDSRILEGFDWGLVGGVWGSVLILAIGCTIYREKRSDKIEIDEKQQ